jgi:peptidyl-prolyl cis-trans isomerase C
VKSAISLGCLILLGVFGVAEAQLNAYGTAARVNGVDISNEMLERNFEEYQRDRDVNIAAIRYPNRVTMMRREVLDQLINQEIIWQAAQKNELLASDDEVEAALQQVREQFTTEQDYVGRLAAEGFTVDAYREHVRQILSAKKYMSSVAETVAISDAAVHEFYVDNPVRFQLPEAVKARHILLKLAQGADEESRGAVQAQAQEILQRLLAGEDFAAVAKETSEDSSAAQGGDLGYFPRGKMVKPFEDAVFALQPGEMSGIVESPFGLHIIKVDDRQEAQTVAEEAAKERITQHLKQTKSQQLIVDELATLRAAADIEVLAAQ